eukprot:1084841-Prymnesium_polylepis.1
MMRHLAIHCLYMCIICATTGSTGTCDAVGNSNCRERHPRALTRDPLRAQRDSGGTTSHTPQSPASQPHAYMQDAHA